MKTTIILFLTLAACGQAQNTFEISADTMSQDLAWLRESVTDINTHLGCEQIVTGVAAQNFTPDSEGNGYNFISFSNNASVKKELDSATNLTADIELGETVLGIPGETDIMLTSFAAMPYSPECVTVGNTCVSTYNVNPLMAHMIAVHEFGHAMGLEHTKNPDDIMFAYIGVNLHQNGISAEQWAVYVADVQGHGVRCPKNGY